MNKFNDIAYPFFGLRKKPIHVQYSLYKITIETHDKRIITLDDKSLKGDYFARMFKLSREPKFDFTCKNIHDVIQSKVRWGMDSKAIPHDLSKLEAAPAEVRRVKRIENSLVWLHKISYPFKINTNENYSLNDILYAIIIKVNDEWIIKEFTYEPTLSQPFVLV